MRSSFKLNTKGPRREAQSVNNSLPEYLRKNLSRPHDQQLFIKSFTRTSPVRLQPTPRQPSHQLFINILIKTPLEGPQPTPGSKVINSLCSAAPVHCCTVRCCACALLHLCIAAPVHCCTCALLHLCIVAPVHCCACALLCLCIAKPVHCCTCATPV